MRGSLLDLVQLMVIIGLVLFGLVIASLLYTSFSDNDLLIEEAETGLEATFQVLDYGIIFMIIGLGMSIVLGAIIIATHPIFIVPSIIILILVVMISPILTNVFMGVVTDDMLIEEANKYPNAIYAVDALPWIIAILGIVTFIALFAKPPGLENK